MTMKLKNKLTVLIISITSTVTSVAAHMGEGNAGMMSGGWMHSSGHMMGYNMWGMGWFGLIIGLSFWILAILGIIYLYQEVTENEGEQ